MMKNPFSTKQIPVQRLLRLIYGFAALTLLTMVGVNGQSAPREVRVGLQTEQPIVRLQGNVPLTVISGDKQFPIDAGKPVTFTAGPNGGTSITAADGTVLGAAMNAVQVQPSPTPPDTRMRDPDQPTLAPPMISLLGPTRHYDGKPDRPYRGSFEIIPTPNGLTVVNIVDVESYLQGVVSSEMSPSYPVEALKAQAVAARTYALKNLGRHRNLGYDLDDTAHCQVYGGYFSEDRRTNQAVNDTGGLVMTYDGTLIDAVYSSTCAGYTESSEAAWGRAVPYLVSVPDFHPEDIPEATRPVTENDWAAFFKSGRGYHCLQPKYAKLEAFRWVKLMTRQELEAGLPDTVKVGTVKEIIPCTRGESGRITALRLVGSDRCITIEKELPIRKALGGLRSSAFVVDTYRDETGVPVVFAFWGGGWGHGIGMCQVGAVGMALEGVTYQAILTYYYHGVTLQRY